MESWQANCCLGVFLIFSFVLKSKLIANISMSLIDCMLVNYFSHFSIRHFFIDSTCVDVSIIGLN